MKVSIDNPGNELKANMTANAEIVLEEFPELADHPRERHQLRRASAIRRWISLDPGAKSGKRKVTIKTGVGNGTKTQIVEG